MRRPVVAGGSGEEGYDSVQGGGIAIIRAAAIHIVEGKKS